MSQNINSTTRMKSEKIPNVQVKQMNPTKLKI